MTNSCMPAAAELTPIRIRRAPEGRGGFDRVYRDSWAVAVDVAPEDAFVPIERIGGGTGYYYANWLWHVRGMMDRLAGGAGLRQGRRDAARVQVGDKVDCWRVVEFEPDRRLRLALEMRCPGQGWLEFRVRPDGEGSIVSQEAIYETGGLPGCIYWYLSYPFHELIFQRMLRNIGKAGQEWAAKRSGGGQR